MLQLLALLYRFQDSDIYKGSRRASEHKRVGRLKRVWRIVQRVPVRKARCVWYGRALRERVR
jgi:hypothetical protein